MITTATIIYTLFSGIVIIFQLALALGVPLGGYSMGGKFPGKYPPRMRIVAVVNAIFLLLLILIVFLDAHLLSTDYEIYSWAIWIVVGFSVLTLVMNIITKSVWERRIWAPVAFILLSSSLIVALGT